MSWVRLFDAAFEGRTGLDPATFGPGPDPAADFAAAAASLVRRWRDGGAEVAVSVTGSPLPGAFVYRMMIGEYLVHGWDLGVATGQPLPFTEEQARYARALLSTILRPEFRGQAFGEDVPVPLDASELDRLIGFAGRDPAWTPPTAPAPPRAPTRRLVDRRGWSARGVDPGELAADLEVGPPSSFSCTRAPSVSRASSATSGIWSWPASDSRRQ
ncbi:hypothetical protein FsymDg_0439 [Candidatus Protofrankia datiscae]|uniref:Mycothiol-dependent maleylpyruvate isomerase metal-binding domain-containing protein n=1 Tax=Candidatus Protofrankia datiscae TaxID=2716812 RepID=F8B5E3_9ACTN|nr:hypothetical protein FsymDg_0439 [Candidatus Protofrankia datiscae]